MPQKNPPSVALTPQSASESLVVQHALALYRDTKALAKNAPHGQFLNCAEAAIVTDGRELLRTTLQTLVQEEINEIEKKTKRDSVRNAEQKKGIAESPKSKSTPPPDK